MDYQISTHHQKHTHNQRHSRSPKGHMKTQKDRHKCSICGLQETSEDALKTHYLKHNIKRPFHCDTCGQDFSFKSNLDRHQNRHHGDIPPPKFACTFCPKSFKTKWNLKEHMNIHNNKTPYICEFCGKGFKWLFISLNMVYMRL